MPLRESGNISIGSLRPANGLFLAPMAGISDLPFRTICRRYGCGLLYTEMVSADGLVRGHASSYVYLRTDAADRPLGVQLFGFDPATLADAARIVEDRGFDLVDLNMGCPVRKVVRRGAGAALMKDPDRIRLIVRAVRQAVRIPVTVKIRSGWSPASVNAPEIAAIAEGEGADALALHPRTAVQGFSGRSDRGVLTRVKEILTIPLIGNGDVKTAGDIRALREETGCDAVMIGRGALGNPWIFRLGIEEPAVGLAERRLVIEEHLDRMMAFYGDRVGLTSFRKHLFWYTRGLRGSAPFRREAGTIDRKQPLLQAVSAYFEALCAAGT